MFGPRKYHKPAFIKFAEKSELSLEFPDTLDTESYELTDGYRLVLDSSIPTQESNIEDDVESSVEEEAPETFVLSEPVRTWTLEETFNIDNEPVRRRTRKKKTDGTSNI